MLRAPTVCHAQDNKRKEVSEKVRKEVRVKFAVRG
jgi:hypothetical protein